MSPQQRNGLLISNRTFETTTTMMAPTTINNTYNAIGNGTRRDLTPMDDDGAGKCNWKLVFPTARKCQSAKNPCCVCFLLIRQKIVVYYIVYHVHQSSVSSAPSLPPANSRGSRTWSSRKEQQPQQLPDFSQLLDSGRDRRRAMMSIGNNNNEEGEYRTYWRPQPPRSAPRAFIGLWTQKRKLENFYAKKFNRKSAWNSSNEGSS